MDEKIREWNERARAVSPADRERARDAWNPGWQDRIRKFVRDHGFGSMTDFLEQFGGEPYSRLAVRFPMTVVPSQIYRIQVDEARADGTMRRAAMDVLPREINRHLPAGWSHESAADFNRASACADWATIVVTTGKQPHLEKTVSAVWRALEALDPPDGWRPSGAADPLIKKAFDIGWPEQSMDGE